ncbi:pro-adrenomedullin [Astyanax mexicanus]|uniref:ADM protein n=1 Tax=Astyanax mexicanus TaxID=7994 RepID=A0A8T2LWE5_ASTMX|nr:pro-adrenomedullin [Astyanax mexicanus]XP_022535374.1 pro-adrenomedullin [Astyanax mexicanus]KAG9273131.1 ADM protein [Astyanax mexicanus]
MKKMVLQNVLLFCLLASVLRCALCAALRSDDGRDNKLSVWLRSRLRRELCVPDSMEDSAELLPQQQDQNTHALTHKHSGHSGRVKRGCNLLTCSMHDLAHRISQMGEKTDSAPPEKIGSGGYGRRRRRSPPQSSTELTHDQGLHPQRRAAPQNWT